jgi:DNA-binding NtrC family response regulator
VVHGIVRSHDGAITVTSAPGQGACFRIFLPVLGGPALTVESSSQPAPRGNGQRILFVDDETSITRVGEAMLRRLGYQPIAFTDPELALAAFRQDPNGFDLVLTDLTMPRMTGVALAGELQRIRKNLPVVLATGYVASLAAPQAAALGIAEVLGKPFSTEDLARTISRALHRATA